MDSSRQGIRYPCADAGGSLVWASQLAPESRPDAMSCVGCGAAVTLRAGARRRPHFAHRPGMPGCTGSETVLHATAIRLLREVLEARMGASRPYKIASHCPRCAAFRDGDLARWRGGSVHVDRVLTNGFRPDVVVLDAGDKPRFVIEVIVTHEPDHHALDIYARRGLPVVCVWPTWENLELISDGLPAEHCRTLPRPQHGFHATINPPCAHPRHSIPGEVGCPQCAAPARRLGFEVAHIRCYKCPESVAVLDVVDHSRADLSVLAASDPALEGIRGPALTSGVVLSRDFSNTVHREYLMHHCGGCGAKAGDNFAYGSETTRVSTREPMRFWLRCSGGHWCFERERTWPPGEALRLDGIKGPRWGRRC